MRHNQNLKIFMGISLLIHAGFVLILLPHILSTGAGGGGNNSLGGHFFEIISGGVAGKREICPSKHLAENKKDTANLALNQKNSQAIINRDSTGSVAAGPRGNLSSVGSRTDGPGNAADCGGDNLTVNPFIQMVREKIERAKNYPEIARRNNWSGEVWLKFLISKTGEVKNITLAKSSGCNMLDNSAINTVKNAAPFLPWPDLVNKDDILVSLPVVFSLQ